MAAIPKMGPAQNVRMKHSYEYKIIYLFIFSGATRGSVCTGGTMTHVMEDGDAGRTTETVPGLVEAASSTPTDTATTLSKY